MRLLGELGPTSNALGHLEHHPLEVGHVVAITHGVKILEGNPFDPTVHSKVVATRPLTGGLVGVGQVEGGCQFPVAFVRAPERKVLGVVVAVDGDDVKDHAAIGLTHAVEAQSELANGPEVLVVTVRTHLAGVEVRERREREYVTARAVGLAVEAARHEVAAGTFGEQFTARHRHARRARHQTVGVLDATVGRALAEAAAVTVAVHARVAHAIEFDDPLLESRCEGRERRRDLVGRRLKGNDRLGPCTTRARTHLDQLLNRRVRALGLSEFATNREPCREDEIGEGHGARQVAVRVVGGGTELERAERPVGRVGETIKRRDEFERHAVLGHPGIHERIAESVGQTVSE